MPKVLGELARYARVKLEETAMTSKIERTASCRLLVTLILALACSLATLVSPSALASQDDALFGDITDVPERDPDAEIDARKSPAFVRAFEAARQRLCVGDRMQFPLEWEGDMQLHGCKKEASHCYVDFKMVKPGSTWKCGKELCGCSDDGNVTRSPLKK